MNTNEPIRILQMIASLYRGGSQTVVMNLYKNIDRSKVQFDFIIDHTQYDDYKQTIEELGGKIYVLPTFVGTNIKEIKKAWNDFFINHPEYKILHSHSRSYASIYFPIAKKHGVKTIIHSHSTGNGDGIKSRIKDLLQIPLRNIADYFMACSMDCGRWLFGEKVLKQDNFYLLNNAVDTNQFVYNKQIRDEYRKEFNVGSKKVFIQVGNFVREKNHLFSLDVFSKVLTKNKDCLFFIVGSGEDEEIKPIKEKIDNLKLNDYVYMLGVRKDVNKLLQMADCYLMPSTFEGLSLAAIEAQASGIVCLLSNTVSSDVKITNVCKFLPLVEDAWINEMSDEMVEHEETYNDVVKAGYDIKTTSSWLCDFYLRILND